MLEEIKQLSDVDSLNTCWSILNLCDNCPCKNDCEDQSPISRLREINRIVKELL